MRCLEANFGTKCTLSFPAFLQMHLYINETITQKAATEIVESKIIKSDLNQQDTKGRGSGVVTILDSELWDILSTA